VLKNCDIKQALIQSTLPDGEEYFLQPPPGCTRSKPGQYRHLIRSLYGLKRATKLWFEMLSKHLKAIGLRSSPNSPCLFMGTLIEEEPPIYVGIYVEDIISFSSSDAVEKKFESLLTTIGSVDFMGQVSLFLGIEFTWSHHNDGHITVGLTQQRFRLESFLNFPIWDEILSMANANWGPQDASQSNLPFELPLFASRSMSAFYVDLLGPIHWLSKWQTVTAGSLAEAEIYATDECIIFLLELSQIMDFLEVKDIFMPGTNGAYNDNKACVQWSKLSTTKGLHHIQMRENHIRENDVSHFVTIQHVDGKINLANIFTKEMKDTSHFVELRDLIMCSRLVTQ